MPARGRLVLAGTSHQVASSAIISLFESGRLIRLRDRQLGLLIGDTVQVTFVGPRLARVRVLKAVAHRFAGTASIPSSGRLAVGGRVFRLSLSATLAEPGSSPESLSGHLSLVQGRAVVVTVIGRQVVAVAVEASPPASPGRTVSGSVRILPGRNLALGGRVYEVLPSTTVAAPSHGARLAVGPLWWLGGSDVRLTVADGAVLSIVRVAEPSRSMSGLVSGVLRMLPGGAVSFGGGAPLPLAPGAALTAGRGVEGAVPSALQAWVGRDARAGVVRGRVMRITIVMKAPRQVILMSGPTVSEAPGPAAPSVNGVLERIGRDGVTVENRYWPLAAHASAAFDGKPIPLTLPTLLNLVGKHVSLVLMEGHVTRVDIASQPGIRKILAGLHGAGRNNRNRTGGSGAR
jgi:hypothetical protein